MTDQPMIIMLGLLICGVASVVCLIASVPDDSTFLMAPGGALVVLPIVAALTIMLSCGNGCHV